MASPSTLDDTATPGVSIAFDAGSNSIIYATRSAMGRVLLTSSTTTGTVFGHVFNTGIPSMSQPSLACAGTELARNCILVTVDPGRPASTNTGFAIQFTEFEWFRVPGSGDGNWDAGPLTATIYAARGNPTVSARLASLSPATYEFDILSSMPVLVGSQNTRQIILLRHTPGTSGIASANLLAVETGVVQALAVGSLHGSLETFDITGARTP